jgi:hypothetical protein
LTYLAVRLVVADLLGLLVAPVAGPYAERDAAQGLVDGPRNRLST